MLRDPLSFYHWKINEEISAKKEDSVSLSFVYMIIVSKYFSILQDKLLSAGFGAVCMQTNVKVRQTQRTLSFFSITDGVFLYLK